MAVRELKGTCVFSTLFQAISALNRTACERAVFTSLHRGGSHQTITVGTSASSLSAITAPSRGTLSSAHLSRHLNTRIKTLSGDTWTSCAQRIKVTTGSENNIGWRQMLNAQLASAFFMKLKNGEGQLLKLIPASQSKDAASMIPIGPCG